MSLLDLAQQHPLLVIAIWWGLVFWAFDEYERREGMDREAD